MLLFFFCCYCFFKSRKIHHSREGHFDPDPNLLYTKRKVAKKGAFYPTTPGCHVWPLTRPRLDAICEFCVGLRLVLSNFPLLTF